MKRERIVSNIKMQTEKKDTTSPYANIMFTSFRQSEAEARLNVFKNQSVPQREHHILPLQRSTE
jgi:hypothetical protein